MVPTQDHALVSFGSNFSTRITATPATFNLTAADATQYSTLLNAFISAYDAVTEARDAGTRSKSLTIAKDTAKKNFLAYARSVYGQVQADASVSDANKTLLGIVVRSAPTPVPVPDHAPALDIVSVSGRVVAIHLHNAVEPSRRGRPAGVAGATVFSYVGATPPSDVGAWKFEGNTTRTEFNVAFPDSVAPGATVWLTAFWRNERDESGPACSPISTNIQFGLNVAA